MVVIDEKQSARISWKPAYLMKLITVMTVIMLICIALGIMSERKAVGSTGIKDDITKAGGIWINEAVFREGHMVWGRVVEDIPAFCRELVDASAE
jgi:protease I